MPSSGVQMYVQEASIYIEYINKSVGLGVLVHTFNPNTVGKQRQADLCEFEASLIYRVSSRMATSYYFVQWLH